MKIQSPHHKEMCDYITKNQEQKSTEQKSIEPFLSNPWFLRVLFTERQYYLGQMHILFEHFLMAFTDLLYKTEVDIVDVCRYFNNPRIIDGKLSYTYILSVPKQPTPRTLNFEQQKIDLVYKAQSKSRQIWTILTQSKEYLDSEIKKLKIPYQTIDDKENNLLQLRDSGFLTIRMD